MTHMYVCMYSKEIFSLFSASGSLDGYNGKQYLFLLEDEVF